MEFRIDYRNSEVVTENNLASKLAALEESGAQLIRVVSVPVEEQE